MRGYRPLAPLPLVLLVPLAAAGPPGQASDWLIRRPTTPTVLTATSTGFSLANGLIERAFFVKGGAWCTVEYRNLISRQVFFRALAPEANLTLNGTALDVGGCVGQPAGHAEFWSPDLWQAGLAANPDAMQYRAHRTSPPEKLFDWTPGRRSSPTDTVWPPRGLHLAVDYIPPARHAAALGNVTVTVHYEMYDGMPVLRKWVSITHGGPASAPVLELQTLNYELLRAPNFAPEQMSVVLQQANNPVPFDEQVRPFRGQSFPGRDYALWFQDPGYDQGNDQEIHVTYTYYTFLVIGYSSYSVVYGGPTGPGAIVHGGGGANSTWASLSVREVLHDGADQERKGLGVRAMHRALAPHLLESPIPFMITDISSSAAMRLAVDQAASTGHELVIVGFGAAGWCGMCFAQLNDPNFRKWFRGEVQYANSKGIEVSAYTLMQHNGWGESVPVAEQTLGRDGRRGPTACFATDWHFGYRRAALAFMKEVGLTGIETDGQYESIPCADTNGDHRHNGIAGGWSYGLQATLDFNRDVKALGAYQTGADGYCFSGANKWNHADTDAFSHLPLWEQHEVGRMYIYDSTINRLPSSGQIGLNDLSALTSAAAGTSACGGLPRVACFDFVLGAQYLMGSTGSFRAARLYDPKDPDAAALQRVISKWTAFYKARRGPRPSGAAGQLLADLVHIARPDGRSVSGVVHVTADASAAERALAAFFNPSTHAQRVNMTVPLYYTGLAPGTRVNITDVTPPVPGGRYLRRADAVHAIGGDGAGFTDIVLDVSLPGSSYAAFEIAPM